MPKTTVKILRNVIHKAAVLKKDSVHALPDNEAQTLIDGEHAEEHDGPAPKEAKEPKAPKGDKGKKAGNGGEDAGGDKTSGGAGEGAQT